jgi:hypothetical protein
MVFCDRKQQSVELTRRTFSTSDCIAIRDTMVGTQRRSQRVASAAAAAAAKEEKNVKEDTKKTKESKKEKEPVVKKTASAAKAKVSSAKAPVKAKAESASKKSKTKKTKATAKTPENDDKEIVETAPEEELPPPADVTGPPEDEAGADAAEATTTTAAASSDQVVVSIEACKQWGAFKTRANLIAQALGNRASVEINKEKVSIAARCMQGILRTEYHVLKFTKGKARWLNRHELDDCPQWRGTDFDFFLVSKSHTLSHFSPPLQPGRGNFVVRVSGVGQPIIELLGMKRPFLPLKALNMDEVHQKILQVLE